MSCSAMLVFFNFDDSMNLHFFLDMNKQNIAEYVTWSTVRFIFDLKFYCSHLIFS